MSYHIIEINDYELVVFEEKKQFKYNGYALVEKDDVYFCDAAIKSSRTSPDKIYSHYWQHLGYENLDTQNPYVRHNADLAFMQLKQITKHHDCKNIYLLVPAYYTNEQLSLLLGIANSCQLNVKGIANADIVRLSNCNSSGLNYLLDIGLHQTHCATVNITDSIGLIQSQNFAQLGVHELINDIALWLNQKLINSVRFDAFHTAQTEQALYNQILPLLRSNSEQKTIKIVGKEVNINHHELSERLTSFFTAVRNFLPQNSPIFLSNRISPFFLTAHCQLIRDTTLFDNLSYNRNEFNKYKDLTLIKKIPIKNDKASETKCAYKISHLLSGGRAYPISGAAHYLSDVKNMEFSTHTQPDTCAILKQEHQGWYIETVKKKQVEINEQAAKNYQQVFCGDRININNKTNFTLINVVEENQLYD